MKGWSVMEGVKVRFALYLLSEGNPVEALEELSKIPVEARSHPRYRSAISQALAASLQFWQQLRRRAETIAAAQSGDRQAGQYLRYCQRQLDTAAEAARAWLRESGEGKEAEAKTGSTPCAASGSTA